MILEIDIYSYFFCFLCFSCFSDDSLSFICTVLVLITCAFVFYLLKFYLIIFLFLSLFVREFLTLILSFRSFSNISCCRCGFSCFVREWGEGRTIAYNREGVSPAFRHWSVKPRIALNFPDRRCRCERSGRVVCLRQEQIFP